MFSKLLQPVEAVLWFEQMILNGIDANATAYNAIIDMFRYYLFHFLQLFLLSYIYSYSISKMKVVYEARHWFNRMINSKVPANTSTFNILIDMYGFPFIPAIIVLCCD